MLEKARAGEIIAALKIVETDVRRAKAAHALSRIGTPVRFNMPFELGLACVPSCCDLPRRRTLVYPAVGPGRKRTTAGESVLLQSAIDQKLFALGVL
ncbi:hypothetical protein [Nitrospira sp. Nam80]